MSDSDQSRRTRAPNTADSPTDSAALSDTVVVGRMLFRTASDHVKTSDKAEVVVTLPEDFPVLLSRAVIMPYEATFEGELVRAVTIPLHAIIKKIMEDPSRLYEIDPRKLEEIIAATYAESGLFDEVTLTPRSGDRGKDLIAVKKGFGSVRIVESVKRYTPGHVVTAEEVDALIGVMNKQPQTSKGVISTTWEFAPKIMDDPDIARLIPTRLELVNGTALVQRLKEYAKLKG